jgi:5-methylcytosine-specific restriction endonuclease McrA
MKREKMKTAKGIIIRVGLNNQNWQGKCKNVHFDARLFMCKNKTVRTGFKANKKGTCLGLCWESTLCTEYFWKNNIGRFVRAKPNHKVFFVFPVKDNSLVLWGHSWIKSVDDNTLYFKKFKPMPEEKWITGLFAKELVGKQWGQGTFRYLYDSSLIDRLESLIDNGVFEDAVEIVPPTKGKKEEEVWKRNLRNHLVVERKSRLVREFRRVLNSFECCVCGFDFSKTYGEIGKGFIEVHHKKPVSKLKEGQKIKLEDLTAVCSNCHRMLHKGNPPLQINNLKTRLTKLILKR